MRLQKLSGGSWIMVYADYDDPPPRNPARREYLNYTLHLQRPFFRVPVAPIWEHPNKHAATLLYAFNHGAICACILQGLCVFLLDPPMLIMHLYGCIALILASVYSIIYRRGYPAMVVNKFKERIGAKVYVP
jgi:hypothetical protein